MSAPISMPTSDLRSTAQDSKRDAARKHKWALGATAGTGRAAGKPRPFRPSETAYNLARRSSKSAISSLSNSAKVARKLDPVALSEAIVDGHSDDSAEHTASDEYESPSGSPPADVGVMYSFDAARSPSQGSQILNSALAKAVKKFEEKETVRIVKDEYDVLDAEGESVALAGRKAKGARVGKKAEVKPKVVDEDEEEYEFV